MIELNGRRSVAAAKPRNHFSVQAKGAAGIMISSDVKKTVSAEKPNLAERSQKTQYFQSDVRTNRGCSA